MITTLANILAEQKPTENQKTLLLISDTISGNSCYRITNFTFTHAIRPEQLKATVTTR